MHKFEDDVISVTVDDYVISSFHVLAKARAGATGENLSDALRALILRAAKALMRDPDVGEIRILAHAALVQEWLCRSTEQHWSADNIRALPLDDRRRLAMANEYASGKLALFSDSEICGFLRKLEAGTSDPKRVQFEPGYRALHYAIQLIFLRSDGNWHYQRASLPAMGWHVEVKGNLAAVQ